MNTTLEKFVHMVNQMTMLEYALLCIFILVVIFSLYVYSLTQEKKKLRTTLDNNIKVFQKAFDISDDAILILSDKNEVIFAVYSFYLQKLVLNV